MNKGLHPQHLGIIIDNRIIAPPSQFAFAYLGTRNKKTLDEILNKLKPTADTPLLASYQDLDLQTLADLVQKREGSQKMIMQSNLLPVNKKRQRMTISPKPQVSAYINSRKLKKDQQPYHVQIYRPFNLLNWYFEGGTRFTEVTQERGNHWNEGLLHEKTYLENLTKTARQQFEQPFAIIDYARASALIALRDLLQHHPHLIEFNGDVELGEVTLPFDFSNHPEDALEAFLLRYAPAKTIREVTGHQTGKLSLAEIDNQLLGRRIVPKKTIDHLLKGNISKGAILKRKKFAGYNWAIIQAVEEHYFQQGRQFKGYSLEFDHPYRTVSIVFDMPQHSKKEHKDISMRIVFDENFNRPYLLYKVFNPQSYANKWHLLNRKPIQMINLPTDRQRSNWVKKWQETDWRTGQKALCTLREPSDQILNRASEIIKKANGRNISAYDLRGWYINNMRKLK